MLNKILKSLKSRHNGHDSVSNHQHYHCLLNCLFGRRSKKISKLCVTGLCVGNSPGIGEFPAQMASYEENVPIWWRHHVHPISSTFLRNIVIWTQYIRNTIMILQAVVWYTSSNTHSQTQSSQFCEVIFVVHRKIIVRKCLRGNIFRKYKNLRTRMFSIVAISWRLLIYNDYDNGGYLGHASI